MDARIPVLAFVLALATVTPPALSQPRALRQDFKILADNQDSDFHWHDANGQHLPFKSEQEILNFLATARVVSRKVIGEGINHTQRVLLEKDGLQMHAAFRDVNTDRYIANPLNKTFIQNHRDYCLFEVAAYRLSRLLNLRIVPPTVEREIDGKRGSLQAWVERAMMEKERRQQNIQPPDEWYWMSQMLTMQLFDNLVGNLDRHQGNLLIDPEWEIWLIDHTQAFRHFEVPHSPEKIQYCESHLWEKLKQLDKKRIDQEFKGLLRGPELRALSKRRDALVELIQRLIQERGIDKVLFSLES